MGTFKEHKNKYSYEKLENYSPIVSKFRASQERCRLRKTLRYSLEHQDLEASPAPSSTTELRPNSMGPPVALSDIFLPNRVAKLVTREFPEKRKRYCTTHVFFVLRKSYSIIFGLNGKNRFPINSHT